MPFTSIWTIDKTLSGATIADQSEPGSEGIEGVLYIPQSFHITGTSPSDCLGSYQDTRLEGVLPLNREEISVFYRPNRVDKEWEY